MNIRRIHKFFGLALVVPFLGWVVTAFVFYFKPGYSGAYASLDVRKYSMSGVLSIPADSAWGEVRLFRTILGDHLCVLAKNGWKQVDPVTFQSRPFPSESDLRLLVNDALSSNPQRYGTVHAIENNTVRTNTGVRIDLNWNRMSFSQRGPDTDFIDFLYRIHYLQWTGVDFIDRILGPAALLMVLSLALIGVRIALRPERSSV